VRGLSEDVVVDVGIPAHGRPEYVCSAIESIIAQTLPNWRLHVSESDVGGGEVERAVSSYLDDPRIRYSATGPVGGPTNWSRLIQGMTAPYAALLHDDDLWDPEFLERRVTFLDNRPECGFVFSSNKEIDEHGIVIGQTPFVLEEGVYPPETLVPMLYGSNVIPAPSLLVRRSAYEAVGPYFEPERGYPFWDYEMMLRLAVSGPGGYIREADCSYRMHDVRVTFVVRRYGRAYVDILERAEELISEQRPDIEIPACLRQRRHSQALLVCALDAVEDGRRRQGLDLVREAIRVYPRSVVDIRAPLAVAAAALGRPGRRLLGRARLAVQRRGLRFHRSP
jgi:glycosyltransferase involved in cell wall biosynthesis